MFNENNIRMFRMKDVPDYVSPRSVKWMFVPLFLTTNGNLLSYNRKLCVILYIYIYINLFIPPQISSQ